MVPGAVRVYGTYCTTGTAAVQLHACCIVLKRIKNVRNGLLWYSNYHRMNVIILIVV